MAAKPRARSPEALTSLASATAFVAWLDEFREGCAADVALGPLVETPPKKGFRLPAGQAELDEARAEQEELQTEIDNFVEMNEKL